MKSYLLSLAKGWFAGLIYLLSSVRSPAPSVIALVGLLGILAGEATVPCLHRILKGHRESAPVATQSDESRTILHPERGPNHDPEPNSPPTPTLVKPPSSVDVVQR